MICLKRAASLVLAVSIPLPQVLAERQCPGNLASVPARLAERTQMIVPVLINGKGPFDFLIDTGAQMSVLDPALAAQLELKAEGRVGIVGVVANSSASFTRVSALATGSHEVEQSWVLIQDLVSLRRLDARLRGLLGGNFLDHFDLLLDYDHQVLCLDQGTSLRDRMKGERIPFAAVFHQADEAVMSVPTAVEINVVGTGERKALMLLDSGTDAAVLFERGEMQPQILAPLKRSIGASSDHLERSIRAGMPLDVKIGREVVRDVSFLSPVGSRRSVPDVGVDGILPTALFRRIFISYSGRYVLLNPSTLREPRMAGAIQASTLRDGTEFQQGAREVVKGRLLPLPIRVEAQR